MRSLREFELAATCCRWPPGSHKTAAVRAAAAGIDWALFEKIVVRHRIEPLALHAIEDAELRLPTEITERLRAEADRARSENLLLAAECERLRRHLEKAGIDHIFIKGLALAALAYGGIELKKGWDIDLLIAPADIGKAGEMLRSIGYDRTLPGEDVPPDSVAEWRSLAKEEIWTHRISRVPIELHWSLVDNPRLIPDVGPRSPRQQVQVLPGIRLATLADVPLYAYLCVHGASSAWFRLKWIADLNAFIAGRPDDEIERLHLDSVALGGGRPSAVALLLIEKLFARPLPVALAKLRRDPVVRLLVRLSLAAMTPGRSAAAPSQSRLGALSIHAVQALTIPGISFFGSEIRRQLFNPMNALELRLPRGARFLYPLLLVPLWLRRRSRHAAPPRD